MRTLGSWIIRFSTGIVTIIPAIIPIMTPVIGMRPVSRSIAVIAMISVPVSTSIFVRFLGMIRTFANHVIRTVAFVTKSL